jgi:type IV fimbrial biogenesis protein FimT
MHVSDTRRATVAQRGVTLVELLTVLVVAAILAMVAMPSLGDALTSQRLRATGTDLMSSLLLARSEAIKRNTQVQIRPKTGVDWTSGWVVETVADGERFDAKDALGTRVRVTGAPASLTYQGNGRLSVAGVTRISLFDSYAHAKGRCVVVDPSGQPTVGYATDKAC